MIKVTPALPDSEWSRLENAGEARLPIRGGVRRAELGDIAIWTYGTITVPQQAAPALIALLNHMMPLGDARRITRELVDTVRNGTAEERAAAAAVLEAYLQPDTLPDITY